MGYDYLDQLAYLHSLGLVDKKTKQKIQYYYAFYDTENECDFEVPFQFFQEYVNREEKKYGFEPTYIAFINKEEINASAWKMNGMIGINYGLITEMKKLFFGADFDNLINGELEKFDILDKVDQEGFLGKMYRFCQMFTFFHELGHIIQDDLRGISHFSEMVDCGAYSQEVHLMEYDADQYAAIQIANHINQWMESLKGELKEAYYKKEMAEMLLSTAVGAIFINYLIFQGRHEGFYTNSCSHPHPAIRATYIMNTIVDAFKSGNNGGFDIEANSVFRNGFILAERVENDAHSRGVVFKNGDEFSRFFEIWKANQKEIVEYSNLLKARALETDGLAVKKYNGRFK